MMSIAALFTTEHLRHRHNHCVATRHATPETPIVMRDLQLELEARDALSLASFIVGMLLLPVGISMGIELTRWKDTLTPRKFAPRLI